MKFKQMTDETLRKLKDGDIVRHANGSAYIVISVSWPNGPDESPAVIATRTIHVSHPSEWLVRDEEGT